MSLHSSLEYYFIGRRSLSAGLLGQRTFSRLDVARINYPIANSIFVPVAHQTQPTHPQGHALHLNQCHLSLMLLDKTSSPLPKTDRP